MEASSSAPGKIILFGEHAVVYGQPALAVPVNEVAATASVRPGIIGSGTIIHAMDIGRQVTLASSISDGLSMAARLTIERIGVSEPDVLITIQSTIPQASGLGSGAAVSAALVRALANYLRMPLTDDETSAIVFESEKLYHGTPSGIDNTVVCHNKPVYFVKGLPPELLHIKHSFTIIVGDTGSPSPTKDTVQAVRTKWESAPAEYEDIFSRIGTIVREARLALSSGHLPRLGELMDRNQELLEQLGVSSHGLDMLISAARKAGAFGAKLSGGGGGGNMIAIGPASHTASICEGLIQAGAARVISSRVG